MERPAIGKSEETKNSIHMLIKPSDFRLAFSFPFSYLSEPVCVCVGSSESGNWHNRASQFVCNHGAWHSLILDRPFSHPPSSPFLLLISSPHLNQFIERSIELKTCRHQKSDSIFFFSGSTKKGKFHFIARRRNIKSCKLDLIFSPTRDAQFCTHFAQPFVLILCIVLYTSISFFLSHLFF